MKTETQLLSRQLESLHALYPQTVMLGSLGRAAIMHEDLPMCRPDGTLRDIDAISVGDNGLTNSSFSAAKGLFVVDGVFHEWIKFGAQTSWLTCPYATGIQEEVSNEVFAITKHPFAGTTVQTFNPHTQLQVQCMMERLRPKDIAPVARFSAFVAEQSNPLPQAVYEPFRRFRAAVSERNHRRSKGAEKVGGIILACIPERIKTYTRPPSRRALNKIIDLTSRQTPKV